MASFKAPVINDNPDGWGPPMDLAPARFQDMPYAPFSKSDKIGRAADWTAHGRLAAEPATASDFVTVDTKAFPRPSGRGGFRGGPRGGRGGAFGRGGLGAPGRGRGAIGGARGAGVRRWDERRNYQREASVDIGAEWDAVEEVTGSALSKLAFPDVSEAEDLAKCGSLQYYDRTFDRVSAKNPKPLKAFDGLDFSTVQTTDDPVIRRLAGSGVGNVFATASILSLLMVAPRSVQSWDVVVQRIGGKLFFETRDDSMVNLPTVNETSHDAPKDEKVLQPDELVNSLQSLAVEAFKINNNFSQAILSPKSVGTVDFDEPNPFDEAVGEDDEERPTRGSAAYRYRKWDLGSGDDKITVVARCEVNGAIKKEGAEPELMTVKALNEYFDPNARQSTDWRAKLDAQRGAVLATEVKNNASKLARWTAEALLADVAQIKFGFVSRVKAGDASPHIVLGTQMYRPKEFAAQINLNRSNMWAILKLIVDFCYKHMQDGDKGVVMKDPNKSVFRLYKVPTDTFEEADEEEEEEEAAE
jgi:translation initiation factor 3 subunit D